jgi:hypothetical protein
MVEKSSTLIPGTKLRRVTFVCEKCGIEKVFTAKE